MILTIRREFSSTASYASAVSRISVSSGAGAVLALMLIFEWLDEDLRTRVGEKSEVSSPGPGLVRPAPFECTASGIEYSSKTFYE